jgi:hypothetical protein
MLDLPLIYQNFVSAAVFEAVYTTARGTQMLLIETRTYMKKMNGSQTQSLFTVIDGVAVREQSLYDLVLRDPECQSLSIPHSLGIEWNGATKSALLTEVLVPYHGPKPGRSVSVKLLFSVDNQFFETELNDTLQDAFIELDEQMGSSDALWFKVCYQCHYGYPKLEGPQDERENLQCFRDSPPEHFEEAKRLGKFATAAARQSGDYFVNAFHTCAAWKRHQPLPAL